MPTHPTDETIDAYVEELLDGAARASLEEHLHGCARCRDEVARQRALLGSLRALPRAIDPGADLRPAIRAARARPATGAGRWHVARALRLPLAAAAVLLVALTAGITSLLLSDRRDDDAGFAQVERSDGITMATFDQARSDYVRTADDLARLLERHRTELEPETVALIERNLRTIEDALLEADAALRADSASPAIREMILATHERKVEVLRWATSL